uniref:Secreted protein n=1 Tax=Cacopsylla melanoneura TaxID=428564 RepID=A0A8D8Z7D9_9HEMI
MCIGMLVPFFRIRTLLASLILLSCQLLYAAQSIIFCNSPTKCLLLYSSTYHFSVHSFFSLYRVDHLIILALSSRRITKGLHVSSLVILRRWAPFTSSNG